MSFRRVFITVLILAQFAGAAELSLEKRVVEHTAPNGIRLLVLERHFSPTVAIRMIFRTGSVDEIEGKTGLAHMFEHMMFKGTKTLGTKNYTQEAPLMREVDRIRQDIDKEKAKGAQGDQAKIAKWIDQLRDAEQRASDLVIPNELWDLYEKEGGTDLNAGTGADLTQYVVNLPSNKLELWAVLDSDRLKNPVFRQFYPEREVVKEERSMRIDTNPDGKLYEKFIATAFSTHPYHHPTIGWEADLNRLTVEDMDAFYRQHYTPDRLTIVVVGDVTAAKVIAMVDKYFGTWKPPRAAAPAPIAPEPPQTAQKRASIETEAGPHLLIGFRAPAYPDKDHFIISALARLLGDGQSSRLYRPLVEKKRWAAAVDVDPASPGERYDTQFVISAAPRFPNTSEQLEKAIFEELEKLKTTPIEPWELEKVRARVAFEVLNVLQTNEGMASSLAYDQCIFGDWRYLLKYQKAIENLTAADLQRVAQRLFRVENSTVVTRTQKAAEKNGKKKP